MATVISDEGTSMLLTIEEACRELRISRTTFWRERRRGLISMVPVGTGSTKRVRREALEAYVRRREEGTEA